MEKLIESLEKDAMEYSYIWYDTNTDDWSIETRTKHLKKYLESFDFSEVSKLRHCFKWYFYVDNEAIKDNWEHLDYVTRLIVFTLSQKVAEGAEAYAYSEAGASW